MNDPSVRVPHSGFVAVTEYVVAAATPEKLETKISSPLGVAGKPVGSGPGEGDAYAEPVKVAPPAAVRTGASNAGEGFLE